MNAGMVLSIGMFFSLMVVGLASQLPQHLVHRADRAGRARRAAHAVAALPPVGVLFAAFLGYNPMQQLLGPTSLQRAAGRTTPQTLTGREFFPHLISGPFHDGLIVVFWLAIGMSLVGAAASALPGAKTTPEQEEAAAGQSAAATA